MDEYESLIIEVMGINKNTSKDTLDNCFSSSKRGGDITNIEYIKGSGNALITFANTEGAKKALETSPHSVEECTLTTRRKKVEISENDKVFVEGISTKTSKDCLQLENETEGISDSDMKDIKYGTKSSETINAIVTFDSPIDFDKIQEGLKKNPTLEGKHISIKTVPLCKTILVKNLPTTATYDSVLYRFENKRNGGGEVEKVHLDLEKRIALVDFKDPNVIDKVLSVKQRLDNTTLSVERYHPILDSLADLQLTEQETSDPTRREVPIPKPRHSLADVHLTERETSDPTRREVPIPKPRHSLTDLHLTERETSNPTRREVPIPKSRDSLADLHLTERETSDPTRREVSIPKPRHSLADIHLTERETPDPTRREVPILSKSRDSLADLHLTERETSDPTRREVPIPKPRHRKPTGFPADIHRDLYLYLKDNHPAQLNQALKDPQPNIEMKDESVHFTFSNQDAKEHFLNYLKGFTYEIVPVNPVLLNHGLREEIKETISVFSSAKLVSFIERYNEGFIKLVGRAMPTFDLAIDKVKKCIANVEEGTSRREDVIEILPVHLKLLRRSTRFQRLEALKRDGCEIQLDDTKGRITVKGSQAQIQKLKVETHDIVGRFGERSLNQSKFSLLKTPKGLSDVKTLFHTENLIVEVLVNDQGNVMLYGMDQTHVQRAYNMIENAIGELKLPPSLKTKSSQDALLNELGASIPLTLQTQDGEPCIVCFKKHLKNLSGNVDDFLERKKTVEVRVPLGKVVLRYLSLHGENLLDDLRLSSPGLNIQQGSDALVVSGEKPLVDNCCTSIQKFTRGLKLESMNYGTHETSANIHDVAAMPIIQNIERKHQCAIVVTTKEETDRRSSFNAPPTSPVHNLIENRKRTMQCRYTYPNGKIIEIHQGDILNHPVDYLVNSANDELKHSGGLAKAIVEKGGRKIQEDSFRVLHDRGRDKLLPGEVVITDGGSLMCKKVIHVVTSKCSPTLVGGHEGETREGMHLRHCCTDVLMNVTDGQTIAIPALGTGIYSVPHDVSAKSLVTAAYEFLQENPTHALKEVNFVDNDPAAIEALMKEMLTRFGHDFNFEINELVRDRWRPYLGAASVTPPSAPVVFTGDMAFETPEGMEIRLTVGSIAKSTTDVIVNTVGSDLNLTKNPCSKAILDEAGSNITSYCEKWIRDHGQVQEGNFAITDGAKLKCKKVLHVSCPSWTADHGEKKLRQLVQKLLAQVQTLSLTSISIPALGTGRLKFPESLVGKVLFEEAMKFSSKHSSSLKIRQYNIVVYSGNTKAVHTFKEQFQIYSKTKNENRCNVAKTERKIVDFLKPAVKKEAESSEDETHGVNVEIVQGNIVEQSTDAIGFLVEEDITQGGQIGAALLKAAGVSLVLEYSKLGKIEAGSVVMTNAGDLKARYLLHMVVKNTALKTGKSMIEDAVTKCLDHADLCGFTSLSLPAVGTGHLKKDAKQSADILYGCIKEYRKRDEKSLKLIRIVLLQENVFVDFNKAFACKDPTTSMDSTEGTQRTRHQITVEIAAESLSDMTKIKEELKQVEAEQSHSETTEVGHKLDDRQLAEILVVEDFYDVRIECKPATGFIRISGLAKNVSNALGKINQIIYAWEL